MATIVTYKDKKTSGGPVIEENSTVLLLYKLALSEKDLQTGQYIESTYSPDTPICVTVNEETLLKGIYQGILGMHGGGSVREIIIPPDLGYGERGYGKIPANTTLFAEICVVSVNP